MSERSAHARTEGHRDREAGADLEGGARSSVATGDRRAHGAGGCCPSPIHFKRKDQLGLALLDRVLATTMSLHIPEDIGALSNPRERLQALFRHELQRLSEEPRRIRLLLEYWARGAHTAVIRGKVGAGVDRYRAAFRNIAEEALRAEPGRWGKAAPADVATAAVSLIIGYPVQAMIDPDQFNLEEYVAAVQGILGRLAMAA
jgi:AcrR family transcriptional regulator